MPSADTAWPSASPSRSQRSVHRRACCNARAAPPMRVICCWMGSGCAGPPGLAPCTRTLPRPPPACTPVSPGARLAGPPAGLRQWWPGRGGSLWRSSGSSSTRAPAGSASGVTTEMLSEFVSRQVGAGVVDFSVGQPAPSLLPRQAIEQAAAHRLSAGAQSTLLLQYGPAAGYKGFRRALAQFLTAAHGYEVQADELMATTGVSHGLDLCVRHLLSPAPGRPQQPSAGAPQPGPVEVFVECPTYFLAQRIFAQAGCVTHHVPTTASGGLDLDALERNLLLGRRRASGAGPRLLYTIPTHHNPRGTTLDDAQRRRLVQLAHQHDLYIVADEVYQLLTFPGAAAGGWHVPRPLRWTEKALGLGAPGQSRVVSLSSFSKLTAPGLRLGWVEADTALLERLKRDGATVSGGCMAGFQAGVVHSALELGLVESHLRQVVLPALEANCRALCAALRSELPALAWHQPQGGYFVFVALPDGVDAAKLLLHAEQKHAVRFTPGSMCGPGLDGHVRLCFAFYTPDELRLGVQRLARALETYTG